MRNELVKYNNDMNKLSFTGLTKSHLNLFMSICAKLKERGGNTVEITNKELKKLSQYENRTGTDLYTELFTMSRKLLEINASTIDRSQKKGFRTFVQFSVFKRFEYSEESGVLRVSVNEDFSFLLNEFTQYTCFELREFVGLKSKYSKNLYRILKQWRMNGEYIFWNVDEFRQLMECPSSYSMKIFKRDCIDMAVREISNLDKSFIDFKCIPKHDRSKQGSPIVAYKFVWKPESIETVERESIS